MAHFSNYIFTFLLSLSNGVTRVTFLSFCASLILIILSYSSNNKGMCLMKGWVRVDVAEPA